MKPAVFKISYNGRDDLRLSGDDLLIWADNRTDATEKARELLRREALIKFGNDLDDWLRVSKIEVKVAEVISI